MTKRFYNLILTIVFISIRHSILAEPPQETTESSFALFLSQPRELVIRRDTLSVRASWFLPDHYKIQYAGLTGFMSVGFGYDFSARYQPTLYYGLLSDNFGGSSVTVHTISLKNSWSLLKPKALGPITPKAGISVNWGHTNNTFRRLPPHYPDKYYFQNKLHLAPFWGAEWQQSINIAGIKRIGIYAEMSTLDAYILELVRTKYVSIDKVWNLAMGVTFYLH